MGSDYAITKSLGIERRAHGRHLHSHEHEDTDRSSAEGTATLPIFNIPDDARLGRDL